MPMAASTLAGKDVSTSDTVTILGTAIAISGSGPKALVTVTSTNGGGSFVAQAQDMAAPQTAGPALSRNGKNFDVGATVTVIGTVTAVTGVDGNAKLTVTLHGSGVSVVTPSVSVHAPHKK